MSLSPTRPNCWPKLVELESAIFTSDRHCVIPDHVLAHTDSARVLSKECNRLFNQLNWLSPHLCSLFPECYVFFSLSSLFHIKPVEPIKTIVLVDCVSNSYPRKGHSEHWLGTWMSLFSGCFTKCEANVIYIFLSHILFFTFFLNIHI